MPGMSGRTQEVEWMVYRMILTTHCAYHSDRDAVNAILIEGGSVVYVCSECKDKILYRDRYTCKHCGVPIKSPEDTSVMAGYAHSPDCPRSPVYLGKDVEV